MRRITLPPRLRKTSFARHTQCKVTMYAREDSALAHRLVPGVVTLPSARTKVGTMLLGELQSVRHLVIPEGVKVVRDRWFYETAIETVVVPESATELGEEVFCRCRHLRAVVFATDGKLSKIGRCCFQNSGLEAIQLPMNVRELGPEAFADCGNLSAVQLNEGLETVGGECFRDTGLVTVFVPASVVEIGCRAFQRCTRLARLEFAQGSRLRRVRDSAFADTPLAVKYVSFPSTACVENAFGRQ